MASVIKDPGGLKRIQWCVGSERRTLRLGNVTQRQADAVKVRIEQVLASQSTGVLDTEAARWLETIDDEMHRKLSRLGLVKPRDGHVATVGGLLASYFQTLDVKPGTRRTYEQTKASMETFFGASRSLESVTPLDGDLWRKAMQDEGLAPATVAKRIKTGRQVFKQAVKWKLAKENPLAEVIAGVSVNRSRMFFVTRETIEKVLAACPDVQWKVLFSMARYGGVRMPSEMMPMTWQDVNFEAGTIRVQSPKTERYGKSERLLPMVPELRAVLMDAFEQAEDGAEHVITKYRDTGTNLRTRANRIIRRAGLLVWPKTFVNMRSSLATELADQYPQAVLMAWLGHTASISIQHYQQVLPEHYARAIAGNSGVPAATRGGTGEGAVVGTVAPGRDVGQPGATAANVAA